jgi:hypothetical protein
MICWREFKINTLVMIPWIEADHHVGDDNLTARKYKKMEWESRSV